MVLLRSKAEVTNCGWEKEMKKRNAKEGST